jgi:uncharacterized protein (DUF3084 family)
MAEFNWPLLLIIVAIGATVSYVGDTLGKKIGKKRISLLRLRPRYTSTIITILTGVGVAALTLTFAVYSSDSVKMAIFGPNIMARQMTELTNDVRARQDELDDMTMDLIAAQGDLSSLKNEKQVVENEVAALREETETLKKGLAEMKEGRVIVFQGEMLAQTSIETNDSDYDLKSAIDMLIRVSGDYLENKIRESWGVDAENAPRVVVTDEMKENIEGILRKAQGRKVFRLTAPSNIVMGQTLEGVVSVFDSNLIYQEGEILMQDTIKGKLTHEDAANILYTMLKQINRSAVSKGILPDPFSGTVGNLDSLDFYDIVDRIVETTDDRAVTFLAVADIYTEGPVKVKIEVGGSGEG